MSQVELKQVNISDVRIRFNYREEYNQEFLSWLTDQIATKGFNPAKPLDVYLEDGIYWIVDGNTRYTAAMRVALAKPYTLYPECPIWVAVRRHKPSDAEFALYSAQGNETNREVDIVSQAKNYQRILDGGLTIADICKQLNHTTTYVEDRLAILKLADGIQDYVKKGSLTIKFAVTMSKLNFNRQWIAFKAYNLRNLKLCDFEDMVNDLYMQQEKENQKDFFGLMSIEEIEAKAQELASTIQTTKTPKISDLEAQLELERKARLEAEQKALAEAQERERIYKAGEQLYNRYTALLKEFEYQKTTLNLLEVHNAALEIQLETPKSKSTKRTSKAKQASLNFDEMTEEEKIKFIVNNPDLINPKD